MSNSTALGQKFWTNCNILRGDSLSYRDYAEQWTFPLFLKIADVPWLPRFNKPSAVTKEFALPSLLTRNGGEFNATSNWRVALHLSNLLCKGGRRKLTKHE